MSEQENMILPLTDENGDVQNFAILDAIEVEELGQYVMVAPEEAVNESEEDDDLDVMILKVIPGEDEDVFTTIEDDEELEQVFSLFEAKWEEEAEEEEEDI